MSSTISTAMASLQSVQALTRTRAPAAQTPAEMNNASLMATINHKEAAYEAEFSVLSQMRLQMAQLADVAKEQLSPVTEASSNEDIKARLKTFAAAYNQWDSNFDRYMAPGGLLQDNEAARMVRFSIFRDVDNPFSGAAQGIAGLRAMGLTTDEGRQLVIDEAAVDAALARNKEGVVATLQQFSSVFQETADCWGADGHVLDNRLHRLADAVSWIESNRASLEAEFGTGAAAAVQGYDATYVSSEDTVELLLQALRASAESRKEEDRLFAPD